MVGAAMDFLKDKRKAGPAELEEPGPHKRSRYYPPAPGSQPPSPVFEEVGLHTACATVNSLTD